MRTYTIEIESWSGVKYTGLNQDKTTRYELIGYRIERTPVLGYRKAIRQAKEAVRTNLGGKRGTHVTLRKPDGTGRWVTA